MSFFSYYFGISGEREETAVCCPFPHTVPNTDVTYFEQHPSAHVNVQEGVFHCKSCGQGHSEVSFIRSILDCSLANAIRLQNVFKNDEDFNMWDSDTAITGITKNRLLDLGISEDVIDELMIRSATDGDTIAFPVFMYDKLLDIRKYTPGGNPKVASRLGAIAGLIVPYDLWRATPKSRNTLICAGEKDMAVARSHGFNAITFTGGENTLPVCISEFRGRNVIICYDNDAPGKTGAIHLANFLKPIAASVKNCTAFHSVCVEDKEDITDFFVKYGKSKHDLVEFIRQTPEHIPIAVESDNIPLLDLHTASAPKYLNKTLRSNVQVVATSDASFITPSLLIGEKFRDPTNPNETMYKGEAREWELTEDTLGDVLHLMDNNFKEEDIRKNYRMLMKIPYKEPFIKLRVPSKETVFKCYVTDMFETSMQDVAAMEYTAYTVGCKLESGKKYMVTYRLIPHPYRGQQLTMIITGATQANDSVSNFIVTPAVKEQLAVFQNLQGTVQERVSNIVERFKGVLGYNGNSTLITAMDLAYHTPLQFNLGQFQHERAYLDTIIVGESRMGKSSTANAMRELYQLGTFTSLAGNAATVPGLVGGSNKVNGSFQTRAGIIPQNHRGLLIFEELGKSHSNIITELTDIRSSNTVRIARVSGTITLPATVRMITLSNVKPADGVIKPIASYPHGISVLVELIGTAEDIARYDLAIVLGDRGAQNIDPFWRAQEPLPKEAYQTRVRWVWSRKPEQVLISEDVGRYMITEANRLNDIYNCHIKIFGPEAWKKIARLAIAVAGYLVSTDAECENIIVTREHVDFATQFLVSIYDNATFKLKQYAEHERLYSTINADGIALLQDIYAKCPALLLHLEQAASTTKNTLQAATGMSNDEYNAQMNRLVAGLFVTFTRYDILPTERFRLGMAQINRNLRVARVGEAV